MDKDLMCECGDPSSQHVDGCEQCIIPECGCREFTEVCDICKGTGEVSTDESDGEGHLQRGVGVQKCECQD